MKRLLAISLLIAAFSAAGLSPARAGCGGIPGISQVCDLVSGGSLLDAIKSRIQIYVETILYTLKIESYKKYSETVSLLEQKGTLAAGHRDDQRDLAPAAPGVSCMLDSERQAALTGVVPPRPTDAEIAAAQPPSLDGGKSTAPPKPVYQPLAAATDSAGEPQPVGPALAAADSSAYDYDSYRRKLVADQESNHSNRRQNFPASAGDKYQDVKNQYSRRMAYYGPDAPTTNFRDADISALTLFKSDTFAAEVNKPKPVEGKDYKPATMVDAANAYCQNLTDPTILDPNRGEAARDTARQFHAVSRMGWDARLSLASTICSEAVARRVGKKVVGKPEDATGLVKIMLIYRKTACEDGKSPLKDDAQLHCGNDLYFSELETNRTLYASLLPSLQGASLLGASGPTDTLGEILSIDQLAVSLNYKIYELQEKLNLIKAAQLAQLVENTRSGPGASASRQ